MNEYIKMGRQYQITKSLLYDDSVKGTVCAELNICIYIEMPPQQITFHFFQRQT